jgi:hypothetical protein
MAITRLVRRAGVCALFLFPMLAGAAGTSVRFDLSSPDGAPFPSDRYTSVDWSQLSQRRVKLPKPNCQTRPSDCMDVDVLNTLDGFNTQPRITVPFTGPIDLASVNSDSIFLIGLGDVQTAAGIGERIGINRVVWNPADNVLSFESDKLLEQHARYALVVTTKVRDARGAPLDAGSFGQLIHAPSKWPAGQPDLIDYLKRVLEAGLAAGVGLKQVAAVSVFTTQSTSADLEKINRQIRMSMPEPAHFMTGNGGNVRAVFPVATLEDVRFERQVGTAPSFVTQPIPVAGLNVVPNAIGHVAFGTYQSPDYRDAGNVIPTTPTHWGEPRAQRRNNLRFQLFLPAGAKPARGWPVAIFGHGFTDCLYGEAWAVASVLASHGIATVGINAVGHGGGPLGTLTVLQKNASPVKIVAGGRGADLNGDGSIDAAEGLDALPPRQAFGMRDGLRQTVIDLMQLVRQIEGGIDVDGDSRRDLDAARIFYFGQSLGGIYGTPLLAVDPRIQAGVINVGGGSIVEVARLGMFRPLVGLVLAFRQPSLINVADPSGIAFDENLPLRNRPPLVNTVPGADAIQQLLERYEWAQQASNPATYAAFLRKRPLPGQGAKPVIFQIAKGDQSVPNPANTALIRAGGLADRTTYFRNDLAYAVNPALDKDPHIFLTNIWNPAALSIMVAAQQQVATFFASQGRTIIDPDGSGPLFEAPLEGALPEDLNFLP